jgi:hypothetical protein
MFRCFIMSLALVVIEFLEKVCPLVQLCHCQVVLSLHRPHCPMVHVPIASVVLVRCSIVYRADFVVSYCAVERRKTGAYVTLCNCRENPAFRHQAWGCK